jgi:DNA-binding NarL/FixJ family response regulator
MAPRRVPLKRNPVDSVLSLRAQVMAEGRIIQVGILGDNTMIQAGLRAVLEKQTDIEFVEHPDPGGCDVLVLCGPQWLRSSVDLELPLSEPGPALLIIAEEIEPFRSRIDSASGVIGLLNEDASEVEILAAIRALAAGLLTGSPQLIQNLLVSDHERTKRETPNLELTSRETEVLRLLSLGLANKEIAFQLKISEHTVKFHVSSIFTKLGATNRVAAVRVGIRIGLLDL